MFVLVVLMGYKMSFNKDMEQQELCYCEKYGILEATRKGHLMIYYSSYPLERVTYKIIVDLTNFSELERQELTRY